MRVSRIALIGVLVLGLVPAAFAGHHEELMKEVADIGDKLAAAMLADDVETMLAMYAEDAISLPNYSPRMQGLDQLRAHHAQMAASGVKIKAFDSEPTEAWKAGDHVIEIGTYAITLEMAGMPGTMEDRDKYMTVYVRDKGGALKIKAETWNTDMNPMMQAQAGGGHEDHGHEGHDH